MPPSVTGTTRNATRLALLRDDWRPVSQGADDPELAKGPVLFNLRDDPAETTNIADKEPDQLNKLLARA